MLDPSVLGWFRDPHRIVIILTTYIYYVYILWYIYILFIFSYINNINISYIYYYNHYYNPRKKHEPPGASNHEPRPLRRKFIPSLASALTFFQTSSSREYLPVRACGWGCNHPLRKAMDAGQNGRPREPQMWKSSLVLTIQLLGYLILTHTPIFPVPSNQRGCNF